MTVAIVLIVAAAVSLAVILGITVSRALQVKGDSDLAPQIQPIDIQAFRNLTSPAEADYLRRRLHSREFRVVQRQRLRATAAYLRVAHHNAGLLARAGQASLVSEDAPIAEAARQLVNDALRLRRNTMVALIGIYVELTWPGAGLSGDGIVRGYEQLNGSAMLLGRLQHPEVPVRISAV